MKVPSLFLICKISTIVSQKKLHEIEVNGSRKNLLIINPYFISFLSSSFIFSFYFFLDKDGNALFRFRTVFIMSYPITFCVDY